MTRRQSLKRALLLTFAMGLGKLDALKAQGGVLTVDLNQWQFIDFKYDHEFERVPMREVWSALKGRV